MTPHGGGRRAAPALLAAALASSLFVRLAAGSAQQAADASSDACGAELPDTGLGDDTEWMDIDGDDDDALQAWERAEVGALRVDLIQTMVSIQRGTRSQNLQASPTQSAPPVAREVSAAESDKLADEAIVASERHREQRASQVGPAMGESGVGGVALMGAPPLKSGPHAQALAAASPPDVHSLSMEASDELADKAIAAAEAGQVSAHAPRGRGRRGSAAAIATDVGTSAPARSPSSPGGQARAHAAGEARISEAVVLDHEATGAAAAAASIAHAAAEMPAHTHGDRSRGRRREQAAGMAAASPSERQAGRGAPTAAPDEVAAGLTAADSAEADEEANGDSAEAVSLMETGMTLVTSRQGERVEEVLFDAGAQAPPRPPAATLAEETAAAAAAAAPPSDGGDVADALAEEAAASGDARLALGAGGLAVAAALAAWAGSVAAAQARSRGQRLQAVDSLVAHSAGKWQPPTRKATDWSSAPPELAKALLAASEKPAAVPSAVKGWSLDSGVVLAPDAAAEPMGEPCPEPSPEPAP